jgi:Uma2 family endonuclease
MTLQTRKLTYQEYLAGPEIKARYDIIDGEMVMAPAPSLNHQTISRRILSRIDRFVTEYELGEVWFAPLDIIVQTDPLRTRQPDLLFVSNDNRGILGDIINGGPDLVVEILSPSNRRRDIESKLADYAGLAVRESWLVSPQAETVEVLSLEGSGWTRLYIRGQGDQVESQVLAGFQMPVSEIFAGR